MIHLLGYLLGLMALFVGDFNLFGLPAFFLVYSSIVVFRYFIGLKLLRCEMLAICIGVILSFPVIFKIFLSPEYYYWAFFAAVGSVILPALFKWAIEGNPRIIVTFNAVLLVYLSIFALLTFQPGERMYLIFGPNVLYRIFGVLFIALAVASSKYSWSYSKQVIFFICFLNVAVLLLMTGSRGATLVLILVAFYYYRTQSKSSFNKVLKVVSYSLPVSLILLLIPFFWRSFYLDFQNSSEGYRIQFLYSTFDFLAESSFSQLVFGVGPGSKYFINYPHNYLVEILVYHGLYFAIINAAAIFLLLFIKSKIRDDFFLFLSIISPIIVGSMLSGDMLDNNVILGLIFYVISSAFMHRRYTMAKRARFHYLTSSNISKAIE